MSQTIHNPHDKFFRQAMTDIRVAIDFFRQHLPAYIQNLIDFTSLQFHKESFIDEELKASAADVIYTANFSGKPGYLYILVEHQTQVDHLIAFRLLKYMMKIMQHHLDQTQDKVLPVVYPCVFYAGEQTYTGTTDLFQLFGQHQELARQTFLTPFQLIDLQQIPDDEIKKFFWGGILEFVLKQRLVGDFLLGAKDVLLWLHEMENMQGFELAKTVLNYVVCDLDSQDTKRLVLLVKQYLSPQLGEEAMTFAERFRQEGREEMMTIAEQFRQEGRQEGFRQGIDEAMASAERFRQEGLQLGVQQGRFEGELRLFLRMLQRKFSVIPTSYQTRIHQADAETLLQWGERLLEAKTLEDIFGKYSS